MVDPSDLRLAARDRFLVGRFVVEPELRRITDGTRIERVEPKVMEVLLCLAEDAGHVVTKDAFMERVWPDTVVTEDALLRCISELRKVLGDDAQAPDYIETIRAQGYCLIAPVREAPPARAHPEAALADQDVVPEPPAGGEEHGGGVLFAETWHWWTGAVVVVALVAFAVLSWMRPSEAVLEPRPVMPLTTLQGEEVDPALSPDGATVVFAWRAAPDEPYGLYLKRRGQEAQLLTDGASSDRYPVFSPDGRRVAFVRDLDEGTAIYVVPVTGGPPLRVKALEARDTQKLAWSPEGQHLAFSAHEAPHAPFRIFLFSLKTLQVRALTAPPSDGHGDFAPAFSPDGRYVAFARSPIAQIADLYVVPVEGGEERRLTTDNAHVTGLDWTPDGAALVFTSDRSGVHGLWRVARRGGEPAWVPTGVGGAMHQPATARASGVLAYVHRSDEANIWRQPIGPAAGATAAPVVASTRHDTYVQLSPDERRLAFVSDRTGRDQLWVADTAGDHPVQLTHFEGHVTAAPQWSPDGRRLAFASHQEGSADIYLINAGGGPPRRLTRSSSNDKAPRWSPDGRWIYFASNRGGSWQVWRREATGQGEAVQVTRHGGFAAREAGRYLYFTRRTTAGLWRQPLDGGPEQAVVDDLEPSDWAGWTVRQDTLYYVRRASGSLAAEGRVLVARPLGAPEPAARVVATLPRYAPASGLDVSPDGRTVWYAREDRRASDLMLVEAP